MKGSAGTLGIFVLTGLLAASAPAAALGPLDDSLVPADPTPDAPNAIRAVYSTRVLDSLEGFEVGVDLDVLEVALDPAGPVNAQQLRAAPEPLRALFEATARDTILAEAQRVLPDADVRVEAFAIDYRSEDFDANPYEPPVRIAATLRAEFTPQFFGLPSTTTARPADLARAFLFSGGEYSLSKALQVPAGYDVVHIVEAPSFLRLQPRDALATSRLEFRADNFQGGAPDVVRLDFAIRLRDDLVPKNVRAGPLVRANFVVDDVTPLWRQAVPLLDGQYVGRLDLDIDVHSLDASLFSNYPLPRQIVLGQVSADVLRIALNEGVIDRQDVESFFDQLVRRSLEDGFGPDVALAFDWEAFERSLSRPVGGEDGTVVAPLVVRAHAVLPFESNKMLVASSVGRLVGMTFGTAGSFALANGGAWSSEYTVAYPEGVHVDFRDSKGLVEKRTWATREGFHAVVPQGTATEVHVTGRSDFSLPVFAIGLVELILFGVAIAFAYRTARAYWTGRTRHFAA